MRRALFLLAAGVVLAASPDAQAQGAPSHPNDAASYCRYVQGVADSLADLEQAPVLFGTGGIVSGADVSPGGSILGPTTRVIAGASYSLSGLYRGAALRDGADAECRRYALVSKLHAFLENNKEGITRGSLVAKLAVLDEAMPHAEQMLAATRAAMVASRATVEQVEATQVRVDALRAEAAETRTALQALARMPEPPQRSIASVLADRDDAEAETEKYDARVRMSHAWDVSVRGGYDRIFGSSINYTPLFALATVTLNLGGLFQPAAENRATEGRVGWARAEVEGADDRVEQALVRLRSMRDVERKRLEETRVLLADLETRHKELQSVAGEKVAEYAQVVWFDLVKTRADHAYFEAHVADLDRLLGPGEPPK
jgi:hypothetical protein